MIEIEMEVFEGDFADMWGQNIHFDGLHCCILVMNSKPGFNSKLLCIRGSKIILLFITMIWKACPCIPP